MLGGIKNRKEVYFKKKTEGKKRLAAEGIQFECYWLCLFSLAFPSPRKSRKKSYMYGVLNEIYL